MNQTILVAAFLATLAMAALWALRRRANRRRLASFASTATAMGRRDLMKAISGLHLAQVGHSRRVGDVVTHADRFVLFGYTCETGLEHERHSHRWRVALRNLDHAMGRATFTSQDWLLATAQRPSMTKLSIGGGLSGLVEDAQAWRQEIDSVLAVCLARSPDRRSWEVLPGMIVVYESGRFDQSAQAELRDALAEVCSLLEKRCVAPLPVA